jgi:kynurenine 3-monooxygenase
MQEQENDKNKVTLVGAGLIGSLLAIYLAKRGFPVEIFERRPDMRVEEISAGRSINLAISTRGIHALQRLGIDKDVLSRAVPMRGRMIHSLEGELTFQPYGMSDEEYINSISRATLNKALMSSAEQSGSVSIQFNQKACGVDFDSHVLSLLNERNKEVTEHKYTRLIGTDGSASAIRDAMIELDGYDCIESALEYGYKELLISPKDDGSFKLEKNALHIWPRGNFMLIALPNYEGSFTCTLFLPFEGDVSFAKLHSDKAVSEFFNKYFKDAVPLLDDLTETFRSNPTGHMVTVKTSPWNVSGEVLLMGDAAHGIVPFYGQGMNCGFEDCTVFDHLLQKYETNDAIDWSELFGDLYKERKVNTDAIADMAVENFVEMRDKVSDKNFLLQKAVEKVLQREFPGRYVSRYALVTFSNLPYKVAMDVGVIDEEILSELCEGLSDPEAVDLKKAEKLITSKLAPVLAPYVKELQAAVQH